MYQQTAAAAISAAEPKVQRQGRATAEEEDQKMRVLLWVPEYQLHHMEARAMDTQPRIIAGPPCCHPAAGCKSCRQHCLQLIVLTE